MFTLKKFDKYVYICVCIYIYVYDYNALSFHSSKEIKFIFVENHTELSFLSYYYI